MSTKHIMDLNTTKVKREELVKQFTESHAKLKTLKADLSNVEDPAVTKEMVNQIFSEMDYLFSVTMRRVNDMEDNFYNFAYEHLKNHVPQLTTASSLEKFLESVGLQDDYDVVKPKLTVRASKNKGVTIEVG